MTIYDDKGNIKLIVDYAGDYYEKDKDELWNDFLKRLEYEKSFRGRIERILENILMAFLCCIFSPYFLYTLIVDKIRSSKGPNHEESKIPKDIGENDF